MYLCEATINSLNLVEATEFIKNKNNFKPINN